MNSPQQEEKNYEIPSQATSVRMVKLNTLVKFLNKELEIDRFEDSSLNGLQVGSPDMEVNKIGFAVDASIETFKKAAQEKCDLLITHHGLFWGRNEPITGQMHERVKFLMDKKLALYSAHLPLDAHPSLGNNAQIFNKLGVKYDSPFCEVGYSGSLKKTMSFDSVVDLLREKLGFECKILPFGPEKIKRITILSGNGTRYLGDAIEEGTDLYLTGDINHTTYHTAKEGKIHYLAAGHYDTETWGVKALMPFLKKKFKIQTSFIDVPTRL